MIRWPDLWFGPVNLNTYGRYIKTTDRPPVAEHSPGGLQVQARTDGESNHGDAELYAGKAEDNLQPIGRSMDEQNSMDGTYRVNSVLMPMQPQGCHSDRAPDKFKQSVVYHGNGVNTVGWLDVMTKKCRYDRKAQDRQCNGCTHPYDSEYVEGLK